MCTQVDEYQYLGLVLEPLSSASLPGTRPHRSAQNRWEAAPAEVSRASSEVAAAAWSSANESLYIIFVL